MAMHEGIHIKDPYAFIDDIEAELADILESALNDEEKALQVLDNEQEPFEIPFSVKRTFSPGVSLIIYGSIAKDWKKIGSKSIPYFSNKYRKIEFFKHGRIHTHKFIYND